MFFFVRKDKVMFRTVWDYIAENRKLKAMYEAAKSDLKDVMEGHKETNDLLSELQIENEKLKQTMRLHAGDCCSLSNEIELFKSHWQDAEKRCDELQAENEKLRKENYENTRTN